MKNIFAVLSLFALIAFAQTAEAQMTKKESKEWKKRIKSLSPEQYKALLEENKSLKGQIGGLKKEVAGVDDRVKEKDDQIADYQDQVSSLRRELSDAKKKASAAPAKSAPVETARNLAPEKGVVFKIQIGATSNCGYNIRLKDKRKNCS